MKSMQIFALAACVSTLALAAPACAQAAAAEPENREKPTYGSYGFDSGGMDASVKPGDNFYTYADGKWIEKTEIPADRSNYGMFTVLDDLSKQRVKGLLDAEASKPKSKLGMAYSTYLDEAAIEKKGLAPIKPLLAQIRGAKTKKQFEALLPKLAPKGLGALFDGFVDQDDKNPENYIFKLYQAGTGLADRDMYLLDTPEFEKIRSAYKIYLAKMLSHAGETDVDARANAIFETERKIAAIQWNREDSSDSSKTYNKMSVAELDKLMPQISASKMLKKLSPKIKDVIVFQPSAFTGIAQIYGDTDVGVFRDQLLVGALSAYSAVLPKAIDDTVFAFHGTTLQGTPMQEARWKRAIGFVEGSLSDDIGKLYAAKYFPPETKAAANELVKNVVAAMGRRIDSLEWMQPETKDKAKQKLANFTTKIGYPDRWHDYAKLKMVAGDAFGNSLRTSAYDFKDSIGRLGAPVRRWEWGMLPQTINAYANFNMNEIVFPAAILQPPFFDPKADAAINYGGIGAVIGHEISHHFDDNGSKYDQTGRLADWWTEKDVAAFKAASSALVKQYDGYQIFPGAFVKGEFTLGENIGDLAGLNVAYDAYKASLDGKDAPVIDGMTGDQRFFLGWAQVWRRKYREENLRSRLLTDPHSPSEQRTWVVRNLDKWYEAFQPASGDKMFLKPGERVRIW